MKIEKYLKEAQQEAEKSDMNFRHGAVIVKGGKILSRGHNQSRTRINHSTYCSTHAEMHSMSCFESRKQRYQVKER
eukprot:TRINITY_DN177_c0_g1_i2.p1 TRINITY_DN177_c0_g1~~TRINITY_DN177_c0_g1_i2.p1  ORF type:complete len:76 (+),score=5.25 TRINITY_DN177_c0_g1_i2:63-290(+)